MGTVFSIDIRDEVSDRAVDEVIAWLHGVDATFSTYRPDSDVSRLGRGEITAGECAPEVGEILEHCAELYRQTDGYFDIYADGKLDPSGYVKGWAIERASDLLRAAGSANHCINGGGDVQCVGAPQAGRTWRVGIADPHDRTRILATASGSPIAVATSGTVERGRHIIDPQTSKRPSEFVSVTVVGRRLAQVDAYATAAFAMGERAPSWLRDLGLVALFVHPDGSTLRIDAPASRLKTPQPPARQ